MLQSFSLNTFQHFQTLKLNKNIGQGAVMCFIKKDVPLSQTVTAIPIN